MPVINSLALLSYNFSINNGTASTVAPELVFNKARSLSGAPVVSGDQLGRIYFGGADSASALSIKLGIEAISTGTIGPNRIPFLLRFYTAKDDTNAPQAIRMAIGSSGVIIVNQADDDTGAIGTPTSTFGVIGSSIIAYNRSVLTTGAYASIAKSSGPGIAIISGDEIGNLTWDGFTGGGFGTGAKIRSVSTGTISAGNVPANLSFWTKPDSVQPITQRLSISEGGVIVAQQADNDTGTKGSPVATVTVLGRSVIAYNRSVLTTGANATIAKSSGPGVAIISGDEIGTLTWEGFTGAGFGIGAQIRSVSTGTISAGNVPADLSFWTKPDSVTPLTVRMVITSSGRIDIAQSEDDTGAIGTTNSTLTVLGSSVIAVNQQNNSNGAYTSVIKNRALGPIVSGDTLGTFAFIGADTASQEFIGSYISSTSTGTIAPGKIPANLTFATRSDATNSLSPRMTISDGGNVQIFTPNAGTALKVDGSLDIESIENVFGVTPAGATEMVIINAAGELGSQAIPGSALTYTPVNTSPYTVLAGDQFIGVDCSGGAITIRLPNAPTTGRYITIKDSTGSASANTITVTTVGGVVTIDGATSYLMTADYESVSVLFNGSSYEIY